MRINTNGYRGIKLIGFGLIFSFIFTFIGIADEPKNPNDVLKEAKVLREKLLANVQSTYKKWIHEQAKKLILGQMDVDTLPAAIKLRFHDQDVQWEAVESTEFIVVSEAIDYFGDDGIPTLQELRSLLSELKGRSDDTEGTEITSLHLQMTMDRRSKFIGMLSAIMKKVKNTEIFLLENMK